MGPRAVDRRNPGEILGGLIPQARFTTIVILIVNFALYGATWLYSQRTGLDFNKTLYLFGAKVGLQYMDGQWWRLVTAGFLHGGVIHILMNSWVLFDLGAEVEATYGTARMIVFYFVSTVTGFFLSAWWSVGLSIGASAGLMGLIGAMIAYGVTERTVMASAMKSHYIRWAVYILAMGLLPIFSIDNAAHIGGLAGGFAIAFVCSTPRARLMWREPLIKAAAGLAVLITVACFVLMFRFMMVAQQELLR
jgi:rhomboid protease GluP